jgi:hypothetical protein
MFSAKNATTTEDGISSEGSGRTPSTAAEKATRARKAPNQAIAWRGP